MTIVLTLLGPYVTAILLTFIWAMRHQGQSKLIRAIRVEARSVNSWLVDLVLPILTVAILYSFFYWIGRKSIDEILKEDGSIWIVKLVEGIYVAIFTYTIILIVRSSADVKRLKESHAWKKYCTAIEKARQIRAVSSSTLREWFSPIGFRYLVEQIVHVKDTTSQMRLLIIDDTVEDITDSWIQGAKNSLDDLTMECRELQNFIKLHRKNKIGLYFVTTAALRKDFPFFTRDEFDRLVIDDECFWPHQAGGRLLFDDQPPQKKRIIDEICRMYMVEANSMEKLFPNI